MREDTSVGTADDVHWWEGERESTTTDVHWCPMESCEKKGEKTKEAAVSYGEKGEVHAEEGWLILKGLKSSDWLAAACIRVRAGENDHWLGGEREN